MTSVEVIVKTTKEAQLRVHLPHQSKPLFASLKVSGDFPGLLSSYYHPEKHVWIVKRAEAVSLPSDPLYPINPPVMEVKVVILHDPENVYELMVGMSVYTDIMKPEDAQRVELQSHWYKKLFFPSVDGGGGENTNLVEFLHNRSRLPQEKEIVTIGATVPLEEGYVLTGGGFTSLYPIVCQKPGVPFCVDDLYTSVFGLDGVNGVSVEEERKRSQEYSGWTVCAASNTGLAAFALALRRRLPRLGYSFIEQQTLSVHQGQGPLLSPSPHEGEKDGMVKSRPVSRSPVAVLGGHSGLFSSVVKETATEEKNDRLLERLASRRVIQVRHGVLDQLWSIELPGLTRRGCPVYSLAEYKKRTRLLYYSAQ